MIGKIRLYESFIIFISFAFGAMSIFSLLILYKRIQKIIEYNNNLEKNFIGKLDKLFHSIDNLSSLIYKMDNTNSDNKSYLKKNSSDLCVLSEKIDSNLIKIDKIINSSYRNHKSGFLVSGHTENQTNVNISKDIKNILDEVKEGKINEYEMDTTTNFDMNSDLSNSSVNELKSLEKDILFALKRLEKEESNSKQQQ